MVSLWKHYDKACEKYEHRLPFAYGWSRDFASDKPRYIKGEDGYWYDPKAVDSQKALLSCTGDLMCEPRMTNAYRYGDDFFFHPLFKYVRNIFKSSDFCIGNLETTLSDATAYAGDYHAIGDQWHCNGPACYLDAVRYAGFDALVTANNHNCDSGVSGLWDTLKNIDKYQFMRTGSYLETDKERVLFVKVCGFRLAILSYANRYNGIDEENFTKEGIDTCLNYFSKEKCLREVEYAKQKGAEFIICYQHWGRDYVMEPNEQQQSILEELRNCGVDYIVGSHTHCLQSHSVAVADDGKRIPMMWSMGNFVTNERKELCKHTGILQLVLSRKNGKIEVGEHFVPCYVFDKFDTSAFAVVPTDTTLNGGYFHPRMKEINEYIRTRLGQSIDFLPDHSITLSDLCEVMGIENTLPDKPVTKLCVQSGTLCNGAVYFAFEKPEFNDRRRLFSTEVSAVVTDSEIEGLPCLVVSDVTEVYTKAYESLRSLGDKTKVVLVAGHTEKTVTRELLFRTLHTIGGVYTVEDGEHTDMSPWQNLHPYHDYCVLEYRADNPLGIRAATLCRPDVLVLTSVPCDVEGLAQSLATGGTIWYNCTDKGLCQAVENISRDDIIKMPYGNRAVECDGLPFDSLKVCTAAAYEIAKFEGADTKSIEKAIAEYTLNGYNQISLALDGVNVVANTGCKTVAQAHAVVEAAPVTKRRIAVVTPSFVNSVDDWATRIIVVDEKNDFENAIKILLKELKDGDTLLLCGERKAMLCQLLRRMFGITDGILPNCS